MTAAWPSSSCRVACRGRREPCMDCRAEPVSQWPGTVSVTDDEWDKAGRDGFTAPPAYVHATPATVGALTADGQAHLRGENPYLDREWLNRVMKGERFISGRSTGKSAAMETIRDGIRRGVVYVRDAQGRQTRMEGYIEVGRMERQLGDDTLVSTRGAITLTQTWPLDRQVVATLLGAPWVPALVLPLPRLRRRVTR